MVSPDVMTRTAKAAVTLAIAEVLNHLPAGMLLALVFTVVLPSITTGTQRLAATMVALLASDKQRAERALDFLRVLHRSPVSRPDITERHEALANSRRIEQPPPTDQVNSARISRHRSQRDAKTCHCAHNSAVPIS